MIYELEESHVSVYNVLVQLIISLLVKEYTYFPNPGLIISFERNWLQFYVLVNTSYWNIYKHLTFDTHSTGLFYAIIIQIVQIHYNHS